MTRFPLMLFAEEGIVRKTFEWARIQENSDWIAPIAVLLAILLFVRWMYNRDAVELRPWWRWLLTALRTAAFLGLLVLYLQPNWRSEREEVRNSRALLLFDTSLSMSLSDAGPADKGQARPRMQEVVEGLETSDFIERLRKVHDVDFFKFDDELKQDSLLSLKKLSEDESVSGDAGGGPGRRSQDGGEEDRGGKPAESPPDLKTLLTPRGAETRLGQALRQLIQQERDTPVSGIIVFTDGGQNAGVSPDAAIELAQEMKIPVFAVGIGSDEQPVNVAVSDLIVPARAYPGDRYTITGYLQAQGMPGKTVNVQVLSRPASNGAIVDKETEGEVLESREVTLGGDGEVLPVKFELIPEEAGRRTLRLRVEAPPDDSNPADNAREADIEIVDRKTRILLFADGPMRDYQYLRNMLYRDQNIELDVYLQSGQEGISQDADAILDDFPTTRQEMYLYDCVVAFDPNWQALSSQQIKLLEDWVSDQGGGLIVVAGPVHACQSISGWVHDQNMATVRNLYPVEFFGRLATIEGGLYAGKEAWPLDFTREGQEADFLWIADTATANREAWGSFPGVYSCCMVRGPKPGATVYAWFSDPRAVQSGNQPVYLAGQFYGSGNVFYLGSGEIWRLRMEDETYFDQFYTKLIRHVSQGRLLRGSTRGVLLTGQDRYLLGNTVEVRAQLSNLRLEPLEASSVQLQVFAPDGSTQTITLDSDPTRLGAFLGQFPALQEGTYRLELPVPESENERISRRIQVKTPDLERENPRRNDALLSSIASDTGGKYYIGMSSATAMHGSPPLAMQLKDRTSTAVLPIAPNPQEKEVWLRWIMYALFGFLCFEWLIRRLLRLA